MLEGPQGLEAVKPGLAPIMIRFPDLRVHFLKLRRPRTYEKKLVGANCHLQPSLASINIPFPVRGQAILKNTELVAEHSATEHTATMAATFPKGPNF